MKKMAQKIALIMNQNSYAGREFLSHLKGMNVDVISIGSYGSVEKAEEERCGGLWKPAAEEDLKDHFAFFNFKSLSSKDLQEFLSKKQYQLGVQGGTGILKNNIIEKFSIGIINFHPGDLPAYRGCSAPEWQLYEGKDIFCTAHFIDSNIDTGDIICKRKLNLNLNSYEKFRASVYPEIAVFVRELIWDLQKSDDLIRGAWAQNEDEAKYRKNIDDKHLEELKFLFQARNNKKVLLR